MKSVKVELIGKNYRMKKKIEIKDLVFLIESNKITENELIKKYQSWTPLDLKDFTIMKPT